MASACTLALASARTLAVASACILALASACTLALASACTLYPARTEASCFILAALSFLACTLAARATS